MLLFNSLAPETQDDLAYEPVPGESDTKPTVACCIPLSCPPLQGRKIGVLYIIITSRENFTRLRALVNDRSRVPDLVKEVNAWYAVRVPEALGIEGTLLKP